MNRSEFLDKLREALENDLSGPVVRENIEYYDSYIQSEVRNGKTEQEVLDMLGAPAPASARHRSWQRSAVTAI